jgi:uncharacterized protein (TIGR02246 family)
MKSHRAGGWSAWLACVWVLAACRAESTNPSDEAMRVVERWATAFSQSDVDTIVSLYAPDASFFGTGSKALVTTAEQIRSYFEVGLQRDKPRGAQLLEHSVKVISDDVVLVTGLDRVSGTKDGQVYHADGRVSFLLQKRGGIWQVVHFHRSALPAS